MLPLLLLLLLLRGSRRKRRLCDSGSEWCSRGTPCDSKAPNDVVAVLIQEVVVGQVAVARPVRLFAACEAGKRHVHGTTRRRGRQCRGNAVTALDIVINGT